MRTKSWGFGRSPGSGINFSGFQGQVRVGTRERISAGLREILWSFAIVERLLLGKLRRFYLVHLRKAYVSAKLSSRKGTCRQCGVCCSFLFKCPALSREGLCKVYQSYRWKACSLFPLDERDLMDVAACGGRCGYFWREPQSFF